MKKKWTFLTLVLAAAVVAGESALLRFAPSGAGASAWVQEKAEAAAFEDPAYDHYVQLSQSSAEASETTGETAETADGDAEKETSGTAESGSELAEGGDAAQEDALPAAVMGSSGILASMEQSAAKAGLSLDNVLNYDWLLPNFYVVHAGTSMPADILNPTSLLSQDLRIKGGSDEPQILIYHTHSQEAFVDSIPGDKSQTIVGVGDYLTEILTVEYGYNVIHHTGEYDVTNGQLDRDPAYSKALPALEAILAENPSIECVIDLHRDGVAENVHLVTDINGQPTAQIMWFNGVGRDENGFLPGLENPYLTTNLAFSLQMRLAAMGSYPGLSRVNYLKSMRYNQHLCMSALIEVGAQTNTVSEAMNAMPVLADILNQVLSGDVQN